jgi:hypothetical protein
MASPHGYSAEAGANLAHAPSAILSRRHAPGLDVLLRGSSCRQRSLSASPNFSFISPLVACSSRGLQRAPNGSACSLGCSTQSWTWQRRVFPVRSP